MKKAAPLIIGVVLIFAAFLIATWVIGGGALTTGINRIVAWINGGVSDASGNTLTNLIPTIKP